MTRPIRSWASISLLPLFYACATATTDDGVQLPDTGGPPQTGGTGSGGTPNVTTGGTSPIIGTGGAGLGGAATGGTSSTGGASSGGASTGGTTFMGACADHGPVSGVNTTGDFGIHTCSEDRDTCSGITLDEPALFECISSHGPNCTSQTPESGNGVWEYVGLCSALGMGGSSNE